MSEKVQLFILFFPVFLFSLTFHECAHAWRAARSGDPTAKMLGRLTLNPLVHMDLLGTFLLPLLTFLSPGIGIPIAGWAKPVPITPVNFRDPRWDAVKVAAVGPAANLLLSLIFSAVLYGIYWLSPGLLSGVVYSLLRIGVYVNLGLAFFNLIPLHPLDGGKVMEGLLPDRYLISYNQVAHYGILIIFVAYYLGFMKILWIPVRFLAGILIPI